MSIELCRDQHYRSLDGSYCCEDCAHDSEDRAHPTNKENQ